MIFERNGHTRWLAGLALLTLLSCQKGDSDSGRSVGEVDSLAPPSASASPVPVTVTHGPEGNWQLTRGGEPYRIRGAGGDGSLELLAKHGGNSGRLWGVDGNTGRRLDEAHRHGLTLAVGIWLEHSQAGFDYSDTAAVARQEETVLAAVERYKNHPAVLLWGLGNEMEGFGSGDDPYLWQHVERLAAAIKRIDPSHPTMTVVAEISDSKVAAIHRYCPSLDIIGINSYGGCPTLPQRYRQAGGTKPYIVTEFGPIGPWEVPRSPIDAVEEPSSTEKAAMYSQAYRALEADPHLNLGSYAFLWGHKQEATATWFGMLLPSGHKLAAVDTLSELWTGRQPRPRCPDILELSLIGPSDVAPDSTVEARLRVSDPEGRPLDVRWWLMGEAESYVTGGHFQQTPPTYEGAILTEDLNGATVKLPAMSGLYRLYVQVDHGQEAAVANLPIRVTGQDMTFDDPVPLPYSLFGPTGPCTDFSPSGWMGQADAVRLDLASTDQPHSGEQCIKCELLSPGGWAGVAWQNPAGDWGELPGGLNFSGASRLTLWARGAQGGEKVKLGIGLLGRDKTYWDTTKREQVFELTDQWQRLELDLAGQDLRRIKTPLFWVVEGAGKPVTFYLDSIIIE